MYHLSRKKMFGPVGGKMRIKHCNTISKMCKNVWAGMGGLVIKNLQKKFEFRLGFKIMCQLILKK